MTLDPFESENDIFYTPLLVPIMFASPRILNASMCLDTWLANQDEQRKNSK